MWIFKLLRSQFFPPSRLLIAFSKISRTGRREKLILMNTLCLAQWVKINDVSSKNNNFNSALKLICVYSNHNLLLLFFWWITTTALLLIIPPTKLCILNIKNPFWIFPLHVVPSLKAPTSFEFKSKKILIKFERSCMSRNFGTARAV